MEFPSSEIKTEADSNDVTECSQDDKPTAGMFGFDCNCSFVFKIGCCSMSRDQSNSQCKAAVKLSPTPNFYRSDVLLVSS